MRNYTLNIRLAAVLVAPLLLACGSDNTGGGTTYAMVPTCSGAGQVLSTDTTGQLVCKVLPAGAVGLPACDSANKALTADGTNASCTDLNAVDDTSKTYLETLSNVEKKIKDYSTQLDMLGAGPASQSYYVGMSKGAATTGRITSGTKVGIPAATAICTNDYGAGAHMCSVYEIYYSTTLMKLPLDATTDIPDPGGWVYMQSWRNSTATTVEPNAGLADNCAGYTSNDDGIANKWNGTRFQFATTFSTVRVPKFFANTLCNTARPIACCR